MNPIVLEGNWEEGYALDYHTLSSEYLGEDENGKAQFNTTRSKLGQLLFELKYRDNRENLKEIGQIIKPFLLQGNLKNSIDYIIPAPSSNKRNFQPVDGICEVIGSLLNKGVVYGLLEKNSNSQSKNLDSIQKKAIQGSIQRKKHFTSKVNILIVDDLYESGVTLKECVKLLREDKNINNIYVLTITKTKDRR